MSEVRGTEPLPRAGRRKTLAAGLVWALPVAAAIIVVYLFIQWLAERG